MYICMYVLYIYIYLVYLRNSVLTLCAEVFDGSFGAHCKPLHCMHVNVGMSIVGLRYIFVYILYVCI